LSDIIGDGYEIRDPNLGSDERTIIHKIFYNPPAADLPPVAVGAYPGGETWLNVAPTVPKVENLNVTGVDGMPGQVSNKGGYIQFTSQHVGQFIIEIESRAV